MTKVAHMYEASKARSIFLGKRSSRQIGARLVNLALFGATIGWSGISQASSAGVWQYWGFPATNPYTYNVDQHLTVTKTAPTRFFAHQIWFQGGDPAYIGLQDTPVGKQARFSVWNSAGGAVAGAGAQCEAFGNEGSGWTCHMPYEWVEGRGYRLRLWETNAADGRVQWLGTIQDTVTGVDTFIGYIWNAPGQGRISGSVSWIENWTGGGGACAVAEPAAAVFSAPILNAGGYIASAGQSSTSQCGAEASRITVNPDSSAVLTDGPLAPLQLVDNAATCLDVKGTNATQNATKAQTWNCSNVSETWHLGTDGKLHAGWDPGTCLDINGYNETSNGTNAQIWDCNDVSETWSFDSRGHIRAQWNWQLCLDVQGTDRASNGEKVQLWNCNDVTETWHFHVP